MISVSTESRPGAVPYKTRTLGKWDCGPARNPALPRYLIRHVRRESGTGTQHGTSITQQGVHDNVITEHLHFNPPTNRNRTLHKVVNVGLFGPIMHDP